MKKNILIIGKNSFLASGIYERCSLNKNLNITLVSHSNLPSCYKNFDWVVNCAFDSSLYSQPIKDENNFEIKVIKEIKKNKNIVIISKIKITDFQYEEAESVLYLENGDKILTKLLIIADKKSHVIKKYFKNNENKIFFVLSDLIL